MERSRHCVASILWRPEGKRKDDRPKTAWRRTVKTEREALGGVAETRQKQWLTTE